MARDTGLSRVAMMAIFLGFVGGVIVVHIAHRTAENAAPQAPPRALRPVALPRGAAGVRFMTSDSNILPGKAKEVQADVNNIMLIKGLKLGEDDDDRSADVDDKGAEGDDDDDGDDVDVGGAQGRPDGRARVEPVEEEDDDVPNEDDDDGGDDDDADDDDDDEGKKTNGLSAAQKEKLLKLIEEMSDSGDDDDDGKGKSDKVDEKQEEAEARLAEESDDDDENSEETIDAATFHYSRPREPLWADPGKEAAKLHPRIIGLGVQKSGTTSLHRYMASIPWVDRGVTKEDHFFDISATAVYDPNAKVQTKRIITTYMEYLKSWPEAKQATSCAKGSMKCKVNGYDKVTLEISPSYITDRRAPWVMHEVLPHAKTVKLLLLLREPAARALSGFGQSCHSCTMEEYDKTALEEVALLRKCYSATMGFEAPGHRSGRAPTDSVCSTGHEQWSSLHECAKNDMIRSKHPWFRRFTSKSVDFDFKGHFKENGNLHEGVILRGIYVDSIKNFLCAGFKPEQFLIITNKELYDDQMGALKRFSDFMGRELILDDVDRVEHGIVKNKQTHDNAFKPDTLKTLRSFYRPYNEALLDLLLNNPFNINKHYLLQEFTQY